VPGHNILLTATASQSVTGSANAIQIFDRTTGAVAASCVQGSQCSVNYSSKAGVHAFTAYVALPTSKVPAASALSSNTVTVSWVGVTLSTKNAIVGPSQPVTVTATSTIPVDKTGLLLQLYDANSKARLTYCGSGSTCSTSLTQSTGGTRSVVAALAKSSPTLPAAEGIVAQSNLISPTWLSVFIDAHMDSSAAGAAIYVKAKSNVDMTGSPWSLGIYNDQNELVGAPCKSTNYCIAQATFNGGSPKFSAVVGFVPTFDTATAVGQLLQKVSGPPTRLTNIQARSAAITPQVTRVLWGVDSCKSFTSDPNGNNGLLASVRGKLGTPDFWGRYLTQTVCPGISGAEMEAAHRNHMGILPIYNDYHCSNVVGYGAGHQYAVEATQAAAGLGIPQNHALVIDIEPPGDACPGAVNIDSGFIQGWYDGVTAAQYVPAYYGDGTAGKEFGSAWCSAVISRPEIGENSYTWSFQPSLLGNFNKGNAPRFSPSLSGCGAHPSAWQYVLSAGGDPDVDQDLLVNDLPLWYP
jgi:hypothetical protein